MAGFACARVHAQTTTWTGSGSDTNWSTSGNWSNGIPSSEGIVLFSGSPTSYASNVDINSDYDSVSFGSLGAAMTLSTSNSSHITIDTSDTVSFADAHNVTINVPIEGAGGLTLSSSQQTGTVTLGASNEYFGPTSVNYGTLTDSMAGALSPQSALNVGVSGTVDVAYNESVAGLFNGVGGGGSVVVGNGATLTVTESSTFGGTISGTNGSIEIGNDAYLTIGGANSYTGTTTIDAASGIILATGGSLSPSSTITGGGSLYFESSSNTTFPNYITGEASVRQQTTATTTLTGSNDYSGYTYILEGTLADGAINAFSPNSIIILGSPGTLDVEHSENISQIFDNGLNGNGTLLIGASGVLHLTSDSFGGTYALNGTGSLVLNPGSELALEGSAANTFSGNVTLSDGASLTLGNGGLGAATVNGGGDLYFVNGSPMTVSAALGTSAGDNFQVILNGTAKVTLTPPSSNNYAGETFIDGSGTLADGEDNSFSPNSDVFIDRGGTLEADFNEIIAGLADGNNGGTRFVTIASGKTLTLNLVNGDIESFGGVISGSGALKVTGDTSGDQMLTGQSNYSGGTTVGSAELDIIAGGINHPTANLVVGDVSGDIGTLNLENASTVTNLDATIGNLAGSTGYVNLDESANVWTNNGTLTVGNAGNGTLDIGGGQVTDVDAVVGNTMGSTGLVQVFGGTWTTTGSLTVGNGGDGFIDLEESGTINIQNGSGTLTLGNANTGAVLFVGQDVQHNVDANAGGVLDAAVVNGTASSSTIDEIIFDTDRSSETPYYFTNTGTSSGTPIEIDGTVHVAIGDSNATALFSASSTYSGGTSVGDYSYLLLGASSSGGVPDDPAMGPVGVGALTLGYDAAVDVSQSNLTLANTINLSTNGDSTNTFGNSSNPDNLTLTGTITGNSQMEWLGLGTLTLSNSASTFGGGLSIDQGTLRLTTSTIGGDVSTAPTSGPAGTGTLTFGNGTTLTRPNGASITISNPIYVVNAESDLPSHLFITGDSTGLFTLTGTITDSVYNGHPGQLNISSPVDLVGTDDVGRTIVNGTTFTLDAASPNGIQDGIVFAQSDAILNIDPQNPTVGSLDLTDSTANFAGGTSNGAVIGAIFMTDSTINFADDSHPEIQGLNDNSGSTDVIHLNGSDILLTLDNGVSGASINFYGNIAGTGSVDIGGLDVGSVVELNGSSSYTGTTTVESGNVAVAGGNHAFGGSLSTPGTLTLVDGSALVVNSGATLTNPISMSDNVFFGGGGTIAPLSTPTITIRNGSVITGGTGILGYFYQGITGNAIDTLTIASTTGVTLAQAGVLQFSIMNDTGTAGSDFSTVNVNGTLTIDPATATNPFVIQLVGIDGVGPYDGSATPASFNFSTPHSWTLLTAGTIVNPGGVFDPSDFQIDTTTYFSGLGTGSWSVSEPGGNTLELDFTPVPEPSTWALIGAGTILLGFSVFRAKSARRAS